jgi:hypothetical protein
MGLWQFLQEWRGSRAAAGITASLLLHVLVVLAVLWGAELPIVERWRPKPGDSLIVELPKVEEAAEPGPGGRNFIARADCSDFIRARHSFVYRKLVMTKIECRSQVQPWPIFSLENPVADVDGILQMQKKNAFFQHNVTDVISPNGEAILQPEFAEIISAL